MERGDAAGNGSTAVAVVEEGGEHVVLLGGRPTQWRWRGDDGESRRRAAVVLVASGAARAAEVASAFGVDRTTLWRWRAVDGAGAPAARRRPGPPPKVDQAVRERIVALRRQGLTVTAIAGEIDLSVVTVRRALRAQPTEPPAATPPAAGRLPAQPVTGAPQATFVGREREVAAVARQLGASRLVTVTGTAGVGKTRLALRTAVLLEREYSGGMYVVPLSGVAQPALVPAALAGALGLREQPGQPVLDAVLAHLSGRQVLLVLDNCEHVLAAVAAVVAAVLERCPDAAVLGTSREALGVAAEQIRDLRPMDIPDPAGGAEAMAAESVQLFCTRAAAAAPWFRFGTGDEAAVVEICRRLDGIPLAIELAAARMATLSPAAIAGSLDDRFLAAARTDADRHPTMDRAVAWSEELLSGPERAVLRRLSVFAGGATAAAARRVCAGAGVASGEVVALLDSLAAKSLVEAAGTGPRRRWSLLGPVRRYAGFRLAEDGDAEARRALHAGWCVALAEQAEAECTGPAQAQWIERLDADHDNLRCAIEWAAGTGDEAGLRLAGALVMFWRAKGHFSAGLNDLDRALDACTDAPSGVRAKALWGKGFMAAMGGRFVGPGSAVPVLIEALNQYEASGDVQGAARCLLLLGDCRRYNEGPVPARDLLARCVTLAREAGDAWCLSHALARLAWEVEEEDAALALFEEAVATARAAGDVRSAGYALVALGSTLVRRGDYEAGERHLAEALALVRKLGEAYETAFALASLAAVATGRGDYGTAEQLLGEARPLAELSGSPGAIVECLVGLGVVAEARGDARSARRRYEDTLAAARAAGGGCPPAVVGLARVAAAAGDVSGAKHLLDGAPAGDPAVVFEKAELAAAGGRHEEAAALHRQVLEQRLAQGARPAAVASLEAVAAVAARTGRMEQAARLLGAAHTTRQAGGYARSVGDRCRWDACVGTVTQALSPEGWAAAWAQGARLSLEDAASYAARGRRDAGRPTTGWASLSPAEREVATLVGDALTNAEIAERLFMSLGTVKAHLSHIYPKLGVRTRRDLARLVQREAK